jgi:Abnormal spindle-like microcephaly-assoc'd, ASPM-SPD-2-Hydin
LSIGQTSSAQTLTITSNGGQDLSLNTLAITGANPGDFKETDTCNVPTALPPGKSCSVLVTFAPSATGSRSAAVTITDNASPATESAQLSGVGLAPAPAVTLVPGSLDFGTTTVGSSTPMNVTMTNAGTAALHITNVALGGANANDFSFSNPACNSAIPVNASCTITVMFTPLAAGLRTASVTLTDDAPDSPQVMSIKGNANAGPSSAVAVNPSSPDFGTTTQGTSTPMNVTVKNTGTAALHITSVVLGGANMNEFSSSNPTCNAAIPISGTCTIALTFTPFSVGVHVASVTLTDDAPDSPQTVQVKGNANAAFSAGAAPGGSTSASVSAGQTAQYLLQLTPGAGYSGTVSLACSGAPLNATCQVPASVSIANGVPAPFTVTVSTKGGAVLPPSTPWRFVPPAGIRVLVLLAFTLLLVIAAKNRWMFDGALRARRLAWGGALIAILLCSVIYAGGCGSSSSSSVTTTPPPIVTPPGSSTIVVTPTAMSSSGQPLQLQPIQLTLTVK